MNIYQKRSEVYLEPQPNIYDGIFLRKQLTTFSKNLFYKLFSKKSPIVDIRLGFKYTSEDDCSGVFRILSNIFGALGDLVPCAQFKKREKHPWRSVNTPPWVFFTFFKLYEWYQIAQSITYLVEQFCEKSQLVDFNFN